MWDIEVNQILILNGGEWLASNSGRFTPGKEGRVANGLEVGRVSEQVKDSV